MPFVFLLLFALLSFQTRWPEPPDWLGYYGGLLLPWVMVTGFWLLASWQAHRFGWQLLQNPLQHAALWHRYNRYRRQHVIALVACYILVLFYFGWGYVAQDCAGYLGLFPGAELIQFSPFLLALILSWSRFYLIEKTSYELAHAPDRFISMASFVVFQARHNLLLVVPPVVLLLTVRLTLLFVPDLDQYDTLLSVLGVGLLVVALVSVPLVLRFFLGLRPLPPGPLRERLESAARRLHFGFNDILVWDTRYSVANAMVSGVVPWLRYVVLTDLLIERLSPEEIEAVFGHEVGHIKHHHMLLYVLFFLGSLMILTGLWKYGEILLNGETMQMLMIQYLPNLTVWTDLLQVLAGPALLFVVAGYIFFIFGYLSRRCESQADLFGCRSVSSEAFIGALEKVADLNGIPRQRTHWLLSWQHPSIDQRIAFIQQLSVDPSLEPRFQRGLGTMKWSLMAGVALGLVLVTWVLGPEQMWDLFRLK